MFGKVTPAKLFKASAVGVGVYFASLAAPLGVAAVVGITAVGAATSWVVDSLGDEFTDTEK